MWCGVAWCNVVWCRVMWCGVVWWGRVMVEVGYGRGRVGSELCQLGSTWFVHACYLCTVLSQ